MASRKSTLYLRQEVDSDRQALREGISQGKTLCKAINMKYKELLSVEQIPQDAPEEEDAEEPPIVYEFEVSCEEDENAEADEDLEENVEDEEDEEGEGQEEGEEE